MDTLPDTESIEPGFARGKWEYLGISYGMEEYRLTFLPVLVTFRTDDGTVFGNSP